MRKIGIIFFHELSILFKDRQAVALLFVMPLALIIFLTFALQDVYQAKVGRKMNVHLVSTEDCEQEKSICTKLAKKIERFNYSVIKVKTLDQKQKVDLALVLPDDIEKTMEHLQKSETLKPEEQIQLLFDPLLDQASRALISSHLMLSLQGILIETLEKEFKDSPVKFKMTDVSHFDGLISEKAIGGLVLPNPIQQTVPAWSLFGMFFILIPLTNSMIRDRKLGVFKRLLSFPVSRWHLIAGKVLPFFTINLIQFLLMFFVGLFVLPKLTGLNVALDFDLFAILVITMACSLAATAYGLLVSCFAKTSEQAHAFGAFSIVILAILGGVMIPRFVMPEFMQTLSQISPMYWGLESYQDIMVRKLTLASVAPKLFLLLGFSLISAVISSLRFRWSEEH